MNKKKIEYVRFPIFVPKSVLDFAEEHEVELDVQDLALSAISGFLRTFASLSPDSRLPLHETRRAAELVEEAEPPCSLCPFCLLHCSDSNTIDMIFEELDVCRAISKSRKRQQPDTASSESPREVMVV